MYLKKIKNHLRELSIKKIKSKKSFNEIKEYYKKKIDEELELFLMQKIRYVDHISKETKEIFEHIAEFTMRGGKRLRPTLVVIGYLSVGGKKEKAILKAAIAVELMESFLLIHDDIMDEDTLRRGKPTFHKIYEDKKNDKKYGQNIAIIAGDILAILGNEAILNAPFNKKNKLKAIEKFNKVIINTCIGQMMDINSSYIKKFDEKDILKTHALKTAIYTIEGPLHIGAILAGAKKSQLDSLSRYAISVGQAFQIQDDILGIFGDEKNLGKPIGSDLKEGKKTLLMTRAYEKAGYKDKKIIESVLGKKNLNEEDIKKIREIIIKTGSLDYSKSLARKLIKEAKEVLKKADLKKEQKEFLDNLAEYIVSREK